MKFRGTCLLLFLALGSNGYAQAPNLNTADNFAVLAGGGVVNVDAGTTIVGNVGSSPTTTINGLVPAQVTGTLYTAGSAVVDTAKMDLTAAYLDAAGRSCTLDMSGTDLGGLTLGPGVYCFTSSALLTGTLTLNGNSTDVWIFKIGSTLTTATGATVAFTGGASSCNVFWKVGSSATIQTGNKFAGNILALTDITLVGGTLNGRALARNGAVTISGKETVISGCSGSSSGPRLVLSPADSSIVCPSSGGSITKTADALSNGVPVVGTSVTFTITGPDAGQSGSAITDASGTATFTINAPVSCSASDSVVATATINGGTATSNTALATFSGRASAPFCSTATSPTVSLATVTAGPPKQVVLSVKSAGGLTSVGVVSPPTTNATVAIPTFDNGTTLAVGVTATKTNQSARAVVELLVVDLCGHTTVFDPLSATITIPASKSRHHFEESNFNHREVARFHAEEFTFDHWERASFDGIGHTEGMVLLQNATPGVELLVISVNGSQFATYLSDGQTKKLDISSALFHGVNTVRVAAFGDPGSSVDLTISDGPK
jgi:hypothetical protein